MKTIARATPSPQSELPVNRKGLPWRLCRAMFLAASLATSAASGADFNQRPDGESGSRAFPPPPKGEGRGEGERRAQRFQVPNDFTPQPPPQNFNANGPWNHDVIAYRVSPSGAVEKAATFERAGVPTIARMKDGRLIVAHQHFPENDRENFDKVAVRFSSDDGKTWGAAQVIQVAGLPEGMRFPFDPTLVPLPDGRVRLYFTGNMGRTFGPSTPAIHSAISTDGVNYTYEPGVRFGVEGRAVIDCAVVLHQGVFHLFAPDNGAGPDPGRRRGSESLADRPREGIGYHATSKDGLHFERQRDVRIADDRRWLGNAQSDGGMICFFGTGGPGEPGRPGGVWLARSPDGQSWTLDREFPPVPGADPGAVKLKDGGWLVVGTGPPRPGTPGARTNRPTPRMDNQETGRFGPDLHSSRPPELAMLWSQGRATGKGPARLETFPLRFEDIGGIVPMGLMAGGHVTPSDHLYVVPRLTGEPGRRFDVVAVADGHVVNIQWRPNPPGGQPDPTVFDREVDLKLIIEHSATCWSYVDHVADVAGFIREQVGDRLRPGPPVHVRIPVKAGQTIGEIHGGFTLDFALVDTSVTRKGFVVPTRFHQRDQWKPHTVDPFDYLDEPLRSMLLVFNPRQTPPFGGKIDHDIDGRLVGNWYETGTGGYAGLNRRWDYWVGHLTFAYHHIDPAKIVISTGNYEGQARQFWVKDNAPDPAKVGERDGPVKYELLWGQLGNNGRVQMRHDAEVVQGTVLAQVLPDRKMKFEAFPGKIATEVKGFASAAKIYER